MFLINLIKPDKCRVDCVRELSDLVRNRPRNVADCPRNLKHLKHVSVSNPEDGRYHIQTSYGF